MIARKMRDQKGSVVVIVVHHLQNDPEGAMTVMTRVHHLDDMIVDRHLLSNEGDMIAMTRRNENLVAAAPGTKIVGMITVEIVSTAEEEIEIIEEIEIETGIIGGNTNFAIKHCLIMS